MNWLDVTLTLVLAVSTAAGFSRGFTRTVLGLTAFLFGLLLACWLYGSAGVLFQDYVSHKSVANFLGFVTVYAAVCLAAALAGWLLVKFYKSVGLDWLDRLLGAAVGLARGVLAGCVLVMVLMAFARKPPPPSVVDSRLAPYMVDGARILSWLAPRELRDGVQHSYQRALDLWKKQLQEQLSL